MNEEFLKEKKDHKMFLGLIIVEDNEDIANVKLEIKRSDGSKYYQETLTANANNISGGVSGLMPIEHLWSFVNQEVDCKFRDYINNIEPDTYSINELMKLLKPGRCSLQSVLGPSTEFTPHFYVKDENKWYGYTRNGRNNTYIKIAKRNADNVIWYPFQTKKSILPKNHEVRVQLKSKALELYKKYEESLIGVV